MNVQSGTEALDELARFGLRVHPVDGTHDELGRRHRTKARIAIDPQASAGPSIAISIGEGEAERLMPLTPFEATTMVDELIARGLLVASERLRHTVERLLARLSEIYTELELNSLKLDTVIFSEAGYCIDSAHLQYSHRPPHHGTMQSGVGGRDNVGVHPHPHGGHR
uniref:Uncharacterized protein n=1 Tax=mine drainage metagenome TaxID=410659 RepID=E6Q0W5_9ZZZZ